MPRKAYMNNKNGNPVDANDVAVHERNNTFFCCTENCNAEMILVAPGTGDAYFRSKHKLDHISNKCIKNLILFNESSYRESRFNMDFAFESMLGLNHTIQGVDRGTTGTRQGAKGGSDRLRIHTLPALYAMCLSRGKNGTYNEVSINDILADDENVDKYSQELKGYHIVETSKYYKVEGEYAFIMNYPAGKFGENHVKIIFENKKMFWKQYEKLKDSNHMEPVIIAGDWEPTPNETDYHSQCVIHRERQIYYAKEQ